MNKRVFLLGGYDLEMQTIKKILKKHGEEYQDENLMWGAKLSEYKSCFNDENHFYGIELEEDVKPPKHYTLIDHHNENSHKQSSLEQVANLLGIELTDDQKLIAANDSGYIDGMKKLCATKEQIEDIRKRDREAQGATKEDELLAQESINAANKSNIIYSTTSHFSTIADKLYERFNHYTIYNETKIVFYGYEIKKLKEYLTQSGISDQDYYYGGGDFGFLGTKEGKTTFNIIEKLAKEVDDFFEDPLYSYHTFMFPFVYKGDTDVKEKAKWTEKSFKIANQKDYNEHIYFYKHVQDALFPEKNSDEAISQYFEHKDGKEGTYTINVKGRVFELLLDGVSLRFFKDSRVGILSFNLKNTKYADSEDILKINDFGRRIFPQFLGTHFTKEPKESFLAECITLKIGDESYQEDFSYFDNEVNLNKKSRLPIFITKLLEKLFVVKEIEQVIDDKMFVISQYNNDALTEKMKKFNVGSQEYSYIESDFWYRYVFVDGAEKTCQSKVMQTKLIKESTYDRWVEWGTLFGISRYSFVSLTGSWYGNNILLAHTQTMYYQIFTLLLTYRASIIHFSNRIKNATSSSSEENVLKLYKNYLNFLNCLYFKEVTAQDQGIELYNQAMEVMRIDKYMADLDHEINELHSYNSMKKEETIATLGAVFLPPAILTGIFGMNINKFAQNEYSLYIFIITFLLSMIIGYWFVHSEKSLSNIIDTYKHQKKRFWLGVCLIITFIGGYWCTIDKKPDDHHRCILLNFSVDKNPTQQKKISSEPMPSHK